MNHQSFLAAIATTLGQPVPCAFRLPHGGEITITTKPDKPEIGLQLLNFPAESFPDGANRYTGEWDIRPCFEPGDTVALRETCIRELARRMALVGYSPPVSVVEKKGDPYAALVGSLLADPPETPKEDFRVSVNDGKYTVIFCGSPHRFEALRYGEPWNRDLVGDNLVYWLAVELDEARKQLAGQPAAGLAEDWQPMDTISKEGRGYAVPTVLLKKGVERFKAYWDGRYWVAWGSGCGCGANHDYEIENPEGWIPLEE